MYAEEIAVEVLVTVLVCLARIFLRAVFLSFTFRLEGTLKRVTKFSKK